MPPAPIYKGARGEVRPARRGRARRSPTPTGSRTPSLFLDGLGLGGGGRGGGEEGKGGHRPPLLVLFGLGGGAHGPALASSPLFHLGPLRPIKLPGGSGTPEKSRFHPEHFRHPNIGFQYINLYVSTILRLLVMSLITSGTPNNLRYIKMHKLII